MRILILGPAWPYRGGIAAFGERLARQFQSEGHEVELITFTLQYPSFLFPGKTQYSDTPAPAGLKIERSINSVNPLNWLRAGRKLRRRQADLIVVQFWLPLMAPALGTMARLARWKKHTRVVGLLHNFIPHEHRPGDRLFCRYFTRSVDAFVSLSASVLHDVEQFDRKKPKLTNPHPLYDNFGTPVSRTEAAAHLGLDPQMTYLLFFGLIRDYKGLDLLLRAYADSRIDKSRTRLLVVGEFYSDGEPYHRLADELRLGDSVVWHSRFVPDPEVRYYFSLADLVVQPYKSATQSGVTQIAYHFEKPMLVTNVGGLPEIVPDHEVGYVTQVDPSSIADSIVEFCSLENKDCFHSGIVKQKQKYGWDKMSQTILEAIK